MVVCTLPRTPSFTATPTIPNRPSLGLHFIRSVRSQLWQSPREERAKGDSPHQQAGEGERGDLPCRVSPSIQASQPSCGRALPASPTCRSRRGCSLGLPGPEQGACWVLSGAQCRSTLHGRHLQDWCPPFPAKQLLSPCCIPMLHLNKLSMERRNQRTHSLQEVGYGFKPRGSNFKTPYYFVC